MQRITLIPTLSLLAVTLFGSELRAQSVVVPAASENTRGASGLNTLLRDSGQARTYMLLIAAAELTGIPTGAVITGISFRGNVTTSNPATWPPSDATWSSYEISIGNTVPQASWSTNLLANFAGTPVQVRSGSMTITPAEPFPNNSALPAPQPNEWGKFYWDFQTPFVYLGGDLGIYFTHPGSNLSASYVFLDYVASGGNTVAYSASTFQATTGAAASFCIPRLHFGYGSPCAGTAGKTPLLVLSKNITAPGSADVQIGNGPPMAVSGFAFGVTRIGAPLPGGCTLYTSPLVVLSGALSMQGRRALPLMAPAGLAGTIEIQGVVLDAGAAAGFTLTNGVSLTVR